MTAGWLAFDPDTQARLRELAKRPVDVFGEAIDLKAKDEPILACLAQRPMRAAQIAARLRVRRWELSMAIESLIVRGLIVRDAEAFLDVNRN